MTTARQETVDEGIDNAKAKGLRSTVFIVCFIVDAATAYTAREGGISNGPGNPQQRINQVSLVSVFTVDSQNQEKLVHFLDHR
jgi:hypothetical protein